LPAFGQRVCPLAAIKSGQRLLRRAIIVKCTMAVLWRPKLTP
jgi:hypothetical protein